MAFTIITDSSCDLPAELVEQLHVRVLPLSFFIDGKQYRNFPDGGDMKPEEFYKELTDGKMITTSAVNVGQLKTVMEAELMTGHDVLCLAFSSGLSATCSSANAAANELKEVYPDRKILVVDTLSASLGQGLLVYLAVKKRREGLSVTEVYNFCEETKLHICHWFTVDDLFHLKRGGRISGLTAVFGSMLNIKPVMHMDNEGKLVNVRKARGRNAAINELFTEFRETAIAPESQTVFISHGNCRADAEKLAALIRDMYGCNCIINFVGPVIGAHSGQGTLALFFCGTAR